MFEMKVVFNFADSFGSEFCYKQQRIEGPHDGYVRRRTVPVRVPPSVALPFSGSPC
jgi:hypothetical protein